MQNCCFFLFFDRKFLFLKGEIFSYSRQNFFKNNYVQYLKKIKIIIKNADAYLCRIDICNVYYPRLCNSLLQIRLWVLLNNGCGSCALHQLATYSDVVIDLSINYENLTGIFIFSFIWKGAFSFVQLKYHLYF